MLRAPKRAAKVVFSSADLPAELDDRARFACWLDLMTEALGRRNVIRSEDRPFSAWTEVSWFGPIGVIRNKATVGGTDRAPADVAVDGVDNFMLGFNVAAPISYSQGGREIRLERGAWTTLDLSEPFHIRWGPFGGTDQARWLNLVVPRKPLLDLVATAEDARVMPIDLTRPAVQHLRRFLDILLGPYGIDDDPQLIAHVGTTLLDLIALVLGGERDAAELACLRGLPAAHFQGICAEIKAHFADPAFSPRRVALTLGLSVRYVQNLLQRSGTNFTERVVALRLLKARTMLMDRRRSRLKIGDIADACGFNEVPHFNRCFRRRFGTSPASYRGGREV